MRFLLFPAWVLFIVSCTTSVSSIEEYQAFLHEEKNGYRQVRTSSSVQFDLNYYPPAFVQLRNGSPSDAGTIPTEEYVLKVFHADPDYHTHLVTESDAYASSFSLVVGADTVRPLLYHYEPSSEIKPYESFVLAFAAQEVSEKTFLYSDPNADVNESFLFTSSDLSRTPILNP